MIPACHLLEGEKDVVSGQTPLMSGWLVYQRNFWFLISYLLVHESLPERESLRKFYDNS